MGSLVAKQAKFARMTVLLYMFILNNGYEFTYQWAYRDPKFGIGHPRSLHGKKLAIDLNLFRDGKYLSGAGQYDDVGEFWESIGGSWGGRFNDDNHFSLAHGGMK